MGSAGHAVRAGSPSGPDARPTTWWRGYVHTASRSRRSGSRSGSRPSSGVRIGRAVVAGRVDRIERDRQGACASSTSRRASSKPTRAELGEHGQLGAYQVAVEEGGFPSLGDASAGAALVLIGKGGLAGLRPAVLSQGALAESAEPAWARALMVATAEGMGGASFVASQGSCRTCPVRSSCPVQPEGDAL